MSIILREPSKRITLTSEQYVQLYKFTWECYKKGFSGTNNYRSFAEVREYFYRYHLIELIQRLHIRIQAHSEDKDIAIISLCLSVPEQMVLLTMLHRIDYGVQFENLLIKKLKTNGRTKLYSENYFKS